MLASVQNKQGTAVATAPDNPYPSNIFVWMKKKEEEKKTLFFQRKRTFCVHELIPVIQTTQWPP